MTTFTSRTGDALLVVDVQVDVMARCWQPHRGVETIADLVARARIAGTPVVWVRHQESGLDAASPGWQVVPELVPEPGEIVVDKRWGDSFSHTDLDDVLAEARASHLWITGAQSDSCVHSTAMGALHRGYDVTLIEDAHTTREGSYEQLHFTAEQLVALANRLVWTTNLPEVDARVCRAAEVCFRPADRMDDEDRIEALEADEQAEQDAEDVQLGLADPDED
ncbi:isochorismatase family protein [Luteococcus sp.]|uniref:isochorismatase family protein n=1 Tax=Luteococcus sp. TaxID=1969402 RepID=UPI003736AF89